MNKKTYKYISEILKKSAESLKKEDKKRKKYREKHGDFVGDVLYLNDVKQG
jgi:hypothetical protein